MFISREARVRRATAAQDGTLSPEVYVRRSPEERGRCAARARANKNRLSGKGHPTTAEIDYTADDLEFMGAIQEWKNKSCRQFPTWREVLGIVREIGYRKA